MKTINLLPKEEKIRDTKSILLNMLIVLLIVILIILAGFSVLLINVSKYLEPQLDDYVRANMQISNYINKLEAYSGFKEEVKENRKLADYLLKEEVVWSDVLYNFSRNMPGNAYITYIEGDSEDYYKLIYESENIKPDEVGKIKIFTIGGYALEYTDVTKLIVHIGNMDNISEVIINNISKNYITESSIEVLSYNISAYFDIEPFLAEIRKGAETEETGEEDILEQELGMIEQ